MIYKYSENGKQLERAILFGEDDGVKVGVIRPDGDYTSHLSKTEARGVAKKILELVGTNPHQNPR